MNGKGVLILGLVFFLCLGSQVFGKGHKGQGEGTFSYEGNRMMRDNSFYLVDIALPESFVSKEAEKEVKAYLALELAEFESYRKEGKLALKWEYKVLVTEKSNGVLTSYVAEGYSFTGGAHPNPVYRVFHYSAKDGREMDLGDVIADKTVYDSLSRMVMADPSVNVAEGWEEGLSPAPENWENWYVEGEDMVFVFPPYQIGPYSDGFSRWMLSLKDNAGLFKLSEILP